MISADIVRINPGHYPLLGSWCDVRGRSFAHLSELVSNRGYLVDSCVAGWLYLTNSRCFAIDNIISDPESDPGVRMMALRRMVDHMIEVARGKGFHFGFAQSKAPSINQIAEDLGCTLSPEAYKIFFLDIRA